MKSPIAVMADKVLIDDGCWEWVGARSTTGYGHAWIDGRMQYGHRAMYELIVGPIPDGHDLDHLCRVRHCVNPAHLEPVTRSVNLRRGRHYKRDGATCPKGHPYDMVEGSGARRCRQCRNEQARERYRGER